MDKAVKDYIAKYGETIESSGKKPNFDLRAAIDESKKLGRPLTLMELAKFEKKKDSPS
ncbi:MAG: hypothetical protein LBN34_09525 [Clostridiales Family XIII bacterium]|jgi:hypothetical protein|nr:hypothetical protein [Clostridiales Family XIII bacterium]